MEERLAVPSAKAVFSTIKLLYPKYHPIWFLIYMHLIYYRIAKRQIAYILRPIPSKLIAHILDHRYFDDVNNTIVVNKKNIYSKDKVLLLYAEGSNFYRPLYVLGIENLENDEILLSNTLYHNFSLELDRYRLFAYQENFIQFADELDISLINSPFDVSNAVTDAVLEKFFKIPKIVKKGDVLEINIKYYAPDIFYRNSKINHVESIHFKINSVKIKGDEKDETCFSAIGQTEIKQSPNVQSYLPKKFYKRCYFSRDGSLSEVPLCPYGLLGHLENLVKSARPFLTKRKYSYRKKVIYLLIVSNSIRSKMYS